ncbi:hypothetical protein RFI_08361 [Reticulomyxa filosa]|uniref:C3H1-type domain-containing protein n=1 Tax=Reticulomyxa filosa TaxID=46433 RepID=X6NU02_RETFI|nr:hypothetical protein RFI_08361 [Reticulomyxa filosa]|eukprot:ETO28767.1 hypothetical protein RFI_08361 [Reticulomyxa filosa]
MDKKSKCFNSHCTFIHLNEKLKLEGNLWNKSDQRLQEFFEKRTKSGQINEFIRRDFPHLSNSNNSGYSHSANLKMPRKQLDNSNGNNSGNKVQSYATYTSSAARSRSRSTYIQQKTWQIKHMEDSHSGSEYSTTNDFDDLLKKPSKHVIRAYTYIHTKIATKEKMIVCDRHEQYNLSERLNTELGGESSNSWYDYEKDKDIDEEIESTQKTETETPCLDETTTIATTTTTTACGSLSESMDGYSQQQQQTMTTTAHGMNGLPTFSNTLWMTNQLASPGNTELCDLAKLLNLNVDSLIGYPLDSMVATQMPILNALCNSLAADPSNLQSVNSVNTCMSSCDGLSSFAVHDCPDLKQTENNCDPPEYTMTGQVLKDFFEKSFGQWQYLPKPNSFNDVDLCLEFKQRFFCSRGNHCLLRHYLVCGFDQVTQYVSISLLSRYLQENPSACNSQYNHQDPSLSQPSITSTLSDKFTFYIFTFAFCIDQSKKYIFYNHLTFVCLLVPVTRRCIGRTKLLQICLNSTYAMINLQLVGILTPRQVVRVDYPVDGNINLLLFVDCRTIFHSPMMEAAKVLFF